MQTRTRLHDLRATDLMQRDLITVDAEDTLREVERTLVDAQVSSVPVLDDAGTVIGVVSMRDVVSRYAEQDELPGIVSEMGIDATDWGRTGDEPCAADLMTAEFVQVAPDTKLAQMADAMVANATHRVLVVEDGRLLGLVSTMDVLRAIAEHTAQE